MRRFTTIFMTFCLTFLFSYNISIAQEFIFLPTNETCHLIEVLDNRTVVGICERNGRMIMGIDDIVFIEERRLVRHQRRYCPPVPRYKSRVNFEVRINTPFPFLIYDECRSIRRDKRRYHPRRHRCEPNFSIIFGNR